MQSSETVRSSVIIGLGSKLQVMQAQQVRDITSYNEIDLELPGKQKCAYFCIVSDQDSTFEFLSSLFFSFLFIKLIRYADSYCEGGCLPTKVKFILDEFPNCSGNIPDFEKKCSTIRSRGCSVAVFFQNIGQMRNRYPDDRWQEIIGACDTTIFLGCTDTLTAEWISDRIGVASVEVEGTMRELNEMTNPHAHGRNPGMNEVKHERFRRIVEKRMTGIIKDLKKLGNCAEPASYEYTEREAEQIIAELELQIFHLRERFAGRKRFSLRNEDNAANDTPYNTASFEVDCGAGVIVVDELLSGPHPGVRVFFKLPDCNRPEEN